MSSADLYKKAYELHYTKNDYRQALALYNQIIAEDPNSPEAGYCISQIANIDAMSEEEKQHNRAKAIEITERSSNTSAENNIPSAGSSGVHPSDVSTVVVADIRMSFSSMVVFMIKWTIASIPALIILTLIFAAIGAVFGGLFAAIM